MGPLQARAKHSSAALTDFKIWATTIARPARPAQQLAPCMGDERGAFTEGVSLECMTE